MLATLTKCLVWIFLVSNSFSFIVKSPVVNCFRPAFESYNSIQLRGGQQTTRASASPLRMVASITLETLSDDHETVGREMADSIVRWLDKEWMPQTVHIEMAQQCKSTYIKCRSAGENDLMAIMTSIADDLNADWQIKYNKDAFVNAWDISNYVSDYLASRTGNEGCGCSSQIL